MKLWQLNPRDMHKLAEQLSDARDVAHIVCDTHGAIILANELALSLFGYTHGELIGKKVELLVPDALREAHVEHRGEMTEKPIRREAVCVHARHKSGRLIDVKIGLRPIVSEREVFVAAIIVPGVASGNLGERIHGNRENDID